MKQANTIAVIFTTIVLLMITTAIYIGATNVKHKEQPTHEHCISIDCMFCK